jgi:predicted nucleotidyltransferase
MDSNAQVCSTGTSERAGKEVDVMGSLQNWDELIVSQKAPTLPSPEIGGKKRNAIISSP